MHCFGKELYRRSYDAGATGSLEYSLTLGTRGKYSEIDIRNHGLTFAFLS